MTNDLEQRPDESQDDYIDRLRGELAHLFWQHIEKNKGQPLFASDIEDDEQRDLWTKRQREQWNARNKILKKLVQLEGREREEINPISSGNDIFAVNPAKHFDLDVDYYEAKNLELRQRWLTDEGKAFLEAIISGLQKEENRRDPARPEDEQPGLDFGAVTIPGGKKFADFYYVHEVQKSNCRDLRWADLRSKNFTKANLESANFANANLIEAELKRANLRKTMMVFANLKETDLSGANLENSNLMQANLQQAKLYSANLVAADISSSNLNNASLMSAKLQGARFHYADITGTCLDGVEIGAAEFSRGNEAIKRSTNFFRVKFSREWRGPKWIARIFAKLGKRLYWRKSYKGKGTNPALYDEGYAKKHFWPHMPTRFYAVDISTVDWSKNPGLKRYIEDEQFIEDFKEKHPMMYRLWAWSSDCGRCLSLWACWSVFIAAFFALAYWIFPSLVVVSAPLDQYTHFPLNLLVKFYFSVVTFTTLGFGDLRAATWVGTIVVGFEVVLGYFFLGGLVAILASKLARRA